LVSLREKLFIFIRTGRRGWKIPKSKKEVMNAERMEVIYAWDERNARKRLIKRLNYQSQVLGIRTYKEKHGQEIVSDSQA